MTLILLVCTVIACVLAWRKGARVIAVAAAGFAVLVLWRLAGEVGWGYVAVGLVFIGALGWHRWSRTSSRVVRWGARSRRKSGVASSVDIARVASGAAMRRKAAAVRPELTALPLAERGPIRAGDVGMLLCRVGFQPVYSSVEDVAITFGGPRTGKTGWLAGRVIDAPGAVLVTSTRTDLLELTGPLRARRGPVYVFNAVGLGGRPSTITFDPLTGCADPVTAAERAGDLLGASTHGGGDREFWNAQARRVLAALMHAAALGDLSMREVLQWVTDPDKAQREVTSLLRSSPAPEYAKDATQFVTTNDRTRTSITSTIMPALGWLTSPAASAAATGRHPFVVEDLLDSGATVYLLGAEETQAAPLVCALTGYVAREARRLAALRPSGRLDPPLTLALDEAALISPVPLESWTADMGGRGVTIIAAFQSRAQVATRWGENGAAIILNNAAAVMVFGGTRDKDDLAFWSTLAGERDEPVTTTDLHGRAFSRTVRRVPVLAPAQVANLPAGQAVVYRRGIPPVVGRVQMAWRRRDVRAHARAERAARRRIRLRVRRDVVLGTIVDGLASRWPDRFGELARRVREANDARRDPAPPAAVESPANVIPLPGSRG
ncbi:hypothetical protein GCM10009836_42940 [Pseudonocardia ailaonensis]|uniref:TraD/TraG TraM recognition site domain-containing protein n=1 Tax=Pseudonocardia ailaonensis TaxID=367279 RepID=A0ABN2NC17_9PSEU